MYKTTNFNYLENLTSKDWIYLNLAKNIAENSKFDSSKKLGAVILSRGKCLLQG